MEVDDSKINAGGGASRQILTSLLATIPNFTYGIQIGWLSPMGDALRAAGVSAAVISWLAAAFPLAAIAGIPFFSYTSDRFGRKVCIIISSVLHALSWTLKLCSLSPGWLLGARVLAGLGAGGCFVVVPAYIREVAEDRWRGALASLTMTSAKVGVIFVYTAGMLLAYRGNQALYLAVAALHALLFAFMPDSPSYLLKIGREEKAAQALSWLRSAAPGSETVRGELRRLRAEQRAYEDARQVTLLTVVRDRPSFAALRMTLVLMAMQTLSGSFALMNFAADVFRRAGTEWSPNALALFMGSLQLAGSFFTTMSIEKFGRKIPLGVSSAVMCVCMGTLATGSLLSGGAGPRVTAVCVAVLAYGLGLAPVPMVLMAEVFTFQVRARMTGICMAFSFLCSAMTVLFYTPISTQFGEHTVFYTFAAVTLLGTLYTVFCVPETKGKTLPEIQDYWKRKETKPEPVFV